MAWHRAVALVGTFCLTAACSSGTGTSPPPPAASGPLARAFVTSADASGVPRDLLVAIAKVEDGLELPRERANLDVDAAVPAAGPLMLRRGKLDTLARAAALARASELALRRDADLALAAGAHVLAELGEKTGARADDLASWKEAVAEMSGHATLAQREEYVHRVYATLARGGAFQGRDGEIVDLDAHEIPATLATELSSTLHLSAGAQYPGAQFFPTSCANTKCDTSRGGASVQRIVIHDTEGGWQASVATLQNDPGKSTHYIVGTDGKVGQFLDESFTAYHAGNYFYNQRTIGIEHVGYATKPFAEAEYAASAKLVAYLANKYGVPKDRAHIIGHDQIPNGTRITDSSSPCADAPSTCEGNLSYGGSGHHTDPGVWEWATFMARLGGTAKCNDVPTAWTCSNDKAQAFRCANAKVELLACDGAKGCEVEPGGQDDACDVKSASSPAKPPSPGGDPGAGSGAGASTGTGSSGATGESPPDQQLSSASISTPAPEAAGGGCSAAPLGGSHGGSHGPAAWGIGSLLLLASVIVGRRARR